MKRREFLILLAGMFQARPLRANGQPAIKAKVGFLHAGPAVAVPSRIEALISGLRATGYPEQQVEVLWRAADGNPARLEALATELVRQGVVVIVAVTMGAVRAVQAADPTMPILAQDLETDPVAAGVVKSYGNP